ncbi:DEKNAAC104736 [Brettanomyces naardenensis]|uniref:DEKNAAC104736 n=1 Tax=Brettanomyces naardenensis TaxID=13370 RepID=A0A448YR89_BRENA|nr:DEKNAAC104736 [Brettanomyces naardenensis]
MTLQFQNINKVLIANRGEIACRIIRACKKYGLISIAVYSKEDIESLHVSQADEAILLPGIGAAAYINAEEIVKVAKENMADVVIPGYGFLSENADFAAELAKCSIAFAGPDSFSIEQFGQKHLARKIAVASNVPIVPGTDLIEDENELIEACNSIGYPVILKATAGGGGMGLKVCCDDKETRANFAEVKSRGASLFKNAGVFVEKYITSGRHIEVQLFGNGLGDIVTFGERECSIQRRHQKVIEESPSSYVDQSLRAKLTSCAKRLAEQVKYKSAGTVEFLVDDENSEFYFLEMNTRLQVEHGISELVYNVDLVYFMLLQADYEISGPGSGIPLDILKENLILENGVEVPQGHAIEVRVYAENPVRDFAPCPGILHHVSIPSEGRYGHYMVRVDHWISTGGKVSPYFDPLLAKVMVWSPKRTSDNMIKVLRDIRIQGPVNNIEYCIRILESEEFRAGKTLTNFLDFFQFRPRLIEFIESGDYTTVQDLPGRNDVRHGVPRSGPVDSLSLQLANIAVGNNKEAECLEFTVRGAELKFHAAATIALAGGKFNATLNKITAIPFFTEIHVPAGSILDIGEAQGNAVKCYLAVKGGFPGVAEWLGSKSCTPGLKLGGHQGRTFLPGDCLEIAGSEVEKFGLGYQIPPSLIPNYDLYDNIIRVISGPHDTPDIASEAGLKQLYSTVYKINFNSNRGAVRLDGPAFQFSRRNGGDGGGHPSNILEYPYPSGGLSTVGSTLVLFGVDGGTLSGFTCLCVPSEVDFWKFGQAAIGSDIKFKLIEYWDAIELRKRREDYIKVISKRPETSTYSFDDEIDYQPVELLGKFLYKREATDSLPYVAFRQAGEGMILIDFSTEKYSLFNNGRQYILDNLVKKQLKSEILATESDTGAYSVCFDPLVVNRDVLLAKLVSLESGIPPVERLKVPSRVYRLPICFEHEALKRCIARYLHAQRPHASYLPSNVDYLMKANCIDSFDHFKKYIIGKPEVTVAVSFLCANPLFVNTDPRCRFATSKYNPSRTETPAGTIGSGSVCQSVYSVDSPGGYMIWGVTLPNWYWDTFCRIHKDPWPLEIFDQVVYYEVDEAELNRLNTQWLTGKIEFEAEETEFDFVQYKKFLDSIKDELVELTQRKEAAFGHLVEVEKQDLEKWHEEKQAVKAARAGAEKLLSGPNVIKINSTMPANVFKINFRKGSTISSGKPVVVLESMKMEIPLRVKDKKGSENTSYKVLEVLVDEGDVVSPGETLMIVERLE